MATDAAQVQYPVSSSVQTFDIRVFRVTTTPLILSTTSDLDMAATGLISSFHSTTPIREFNVNRTALEIYSRGYTDKRIVGIDRNFADYRIGGRLSSPVRLPFRRLRYLDHKSYSGDVSGLIGESVFVYFLVEVMRLDRRYIQHLRPEKNAGFVTCDFLFLDFNNRLQSIIPSYRNPLYAEVKSSTGKLSGNRVSHGLSQLKDTIGSWDAHGILALVEKNQDRVGYNMYLVIVRGI